MSKAFEIHDLRSLREEIIQLRDAKADLLVNLRKLEKERNQNREDRDKLNKVASENFAKVRDLKDHRDKNNRSIQELKSVRRSVLEEMKGLIEKAKLLQEEITSLEITENDIQQSHRLRKRIDSLDWKIQTTPTMGIAEERQLTEQVNALMSQLGEISVSTEKLKARKEINREINNLRGFLDHSWKDFQDLVENSQKSHQELTDLYETGKKAKDDADKCHKDFLERANAIRKLREEFRELNKVLRDKSSIFREQNRVQKERVQIEREKASAELLEEQKAIIEEKLSTKKKKILTFEEMRIMMTQDPDFLHEKNESVPEEEE
ncbi:MAG: hypothetical protein ACTSRJ_06000 [Candidatus Hodarchaeales archaeon]